MSTENKQQQKGNAVLPLVVGSAEVPVVRVRNYNEETGETEDGTVIDATLNTYLVIPDYNLQMTVIWDKINCDVLR
jgi:hypothetical protein